MFPRPIRSGCEKLTEQPPPRLRLRRMDESPGRGLGVLGHLDIDQIRPAIRQRLFQCRTKPVRRRHSRAADFAATCNDDDIWIAVARQHYARYAEVALMT